ncbi:DC1 [Arabidopsis suecica]|uniref:DC1 n=1 Tax=Arabidopsis suecica TaxID=45249 RepID=A0A8T2EIF8_ARASU|nr:DC1 [Arabidopsis suecica]
MASEGVSLPLIHDLKKGDCSGRLECVDHASESIVHPLHPIHSLRLLSRPYRGCDICGREIRGLSYNCETCGFDMDLYCAKYPPPEVIDMSETHPHKLTILKERIKFDCDDKCGRNVKGYPYKCHECELHFHVDCVWHPTELKHPLEVNHPYHALHPLKPLTARFPNYSDGKCRLCGSMVEDRLFYHCSSCNFTLGLCCIFKLPQPSLLNLKAHDHQLTLLPRLDSFTCNACGLKGDRSPYVCFQCGFMIHQDCLGLPRLININRHDHRVARTSVLGVVNSVCGVCRQKVDWTCGGFSCQRCPDYVAHSKCATRKDVWNGKELEGVPEEIEDIKPYVVIDDTTIQHFSHKEHYLRLHDNGFLCDDNKRCRACTHPICLQSFYGCMDCDFILHQNCAGFLKMKWHVLHNERLTLVTNETTAFWCDACSRVSNGFRYQHGAMIFDVLCGSISEPFVHPSHPDHPLYNISEDGGLKSCNGCKNKHYNTLRCIEDDCRFVLCFKCATLPQVIKHRVDDHPLSLCYGEEASDKFWCDICEKETNPETWFYTCKDHRASLHTMCVLGVNFGLMLKSTLIDDWDNRPYEVVLNNSVSRPFCSYCELRCIFPIILKRLGTSQKYCCSPYCAYWVIG